MRWVNFLFLGDTRQATVSLFLSREMRHFSFSTSSEQQRIWHRERWPGCLDPASQVWRQSHFQAQRPCCTDTVVLSHPQALCKEAVWCPPSLHPSKLFACECILLPADICVHQWVAAFSKKTFLPSFDCWIHLVSLGELWPTLYHQCYGWIAIL